VNEGKYILTTRMVTPKESMLLRVEIIFDIFYKRENGG